MAGIAVRHVLELEFELADRMVVSLNEGSLRCLFFTVWCSRTIGCFLVALLSLQI